MDFLQALNPITIYNGLMNFLETGGNVLVVIMAATFALWALIIERYWYFFGVQAGDIKRVKKKWAERSDHRSWNAHQIRNMLISDIRQAAESNLGMIKGLVGVAPLLGLLGTVTGMVEVFDVMAFTGSSNARAMAAGVSKATIPTMAGMVVSLSGLYFIARLDVRARRSVQRVADDLEIKHI